MNRYRFRLETVRRIRRVQEDLAVGAWRVAQADLQAAEAERSAAIERYRGREVPAGAMGAAAFLAECDRAARSADAVVSSGVRCVERSVVVDERRADWSIAAQRVAGLDKFDERSRADHALTAARSEAVIDDDRAATAFRARHESSKGSR